MIKKNIPNFFTLCNLFGGCIAIVFAFEGNLIWSAYMVGICCVFDFLDGMVARLLNVKSEIGKQLDSLADMVSFGVVPGVMMFRLLMIVVGNYFGKRVSEIPPPSEPIFDILSPVVLLFLPYISFLITIFSAIRLAKFNLDAKQSDSFIGLPTPANTILISSLVLIVCGHNDESSNFGYYQNQSFILTSSFIIPFIIISSFLLVAPLPLFALKFKNFSWADNKVRYIFLLLSLVLLIIFRFVGIPLIIVLYIVLSIINNIVSSSKTQQ